VPSFEGTNENPSTEETKVEQAGEDKNKVVT